MMLPDDVIGNAMEKALHHPINMMAVSIDRGVFLRFALNFGWQLSERISPGSPSLRTAAWRCHALPLTYRLSDRGGSQSFHP